MLTDETQRVIFDIRYDTVAGQWDEYERYIRQIQDEEERIAREKAEEVERD